MFRSTPPDLIRLTIPRSAAPVFIRRLGLAMAEGCDEGGVLARLLQQIAGEVSRGGGRVRVGCRACGYDWYAIPNDMFCPVCSSRNLRFEILEGR